MLATAPAAARDGSRLCAPAQCRPEGRAFEFKARGFLPGHRPNKCSGSLKKSAAPKYMERTNGLDRLGAEAQWDAKHGCICIAGEPKLLAPGA